MPETAVPYPSHDPARHASVVSSAVHRLGMVTTLAPMSATAVLVVLAWLLVGAIVSFPSWWATVLYSTSAVVTVVMVFTIQHTQARLELATQRKLDELLLATPRADNRLVAAEIGSDDELAAITELHLRERADAAEETTRSDLRDRP